MTDFENVFKEFCNFSNKPINLIFIMNGFEQEKKLDAVTYILNFDKQKSPSLSLYKKEIHFQECQKLIGSLIEDKEIDKDKLFHILQIQRPDLLTIFFQQFKNLPDSNYQEETLWILGKKHTLHLDRLQMQPVKVHDKEIFLDEQNVHREEVWFSIYTSIYTLLCEYPLDEDKNYDFLIQKELEKNNLWNYIIQSRLSYFSNLSIFLRPEEKMYKVFGKQVLHLVWNYIFHSESEFQKQIILRFYDEVLETEGTCTLGYFSRILNSLSGFHPAIKIGSSISLNDLFLQKCRSLFINQDDLLLEMIDPPLQGRLHIFLEQNLYRLYRALIIEINQFISEMQFKEFLVSHFPKLANSLSIDFFILSS